MPQKLVALDVCEDSIHVDRCGETGLTIWIPSFSLSFITKWPQVVWDVLSSALKFVLQLSRVNERRLLLHKFTNSRSRLKGIMTPQKLSNPNHIFTTINQTQIINAESLMSKGGYCNMLKRDVSLLRFIIQTITSKRIVVTLTVQTRDDYIWKAEVTLSPWKSVRTGALVCLWGLGMSLGAFLFYRLFTHWQQRHLSKQTSDDSIQSQLNVNTSPASDTSLSFDELPSSPLVKSPSPSDSAVPRDSRSSSVTLRARELSEENFHTDSLTSQTNAAFVTLTDLSSRFTEEYSENGVHSWKMGDNVSELCSDNASSKPAWSVTGDEAAEHEFLYQCEDVDNFSFENKPTHSYDCSISSPSVYHDTFSNQNFSFTRALDILKSSYSSPAKRASIFPDYINEYIDDCSTTWELSSQLTFNELTDENLDNISSSMSSSSLISKPLHSSHPDASKAVRSVQTVDDNLSTTSLSTTTSVMTFTTPSFITNNSHQRYSLLNYESLSLQSSPELSLFRRKHSRYFFPHFSALDASLSSSKDERFHENEEIGISDTPQKISCQENEDPDIRPSRQERFSSVDFTSHRTSKFTSPQSVASRLSWNDDNVIWKFYHMELQLLRLQRETQSIQMEMNYFKERSAKNVHGIDFVGKKILAVEKMMRQRNSLEIDSCKSEEFMRIREMRRIMSSDDSESELLSEDDLFKELLDRYGREPENDLNFHFDRQYVEEHFPEFSIDELDMLQYLCEQTTL